VRVRLQWLDGGAVALDSGDKPAFTPLEDVPGPYRLILTEGAEGQRAWIYIGKPTTCDDASPATTATQDRGNTPAFEPAVTGLRERIARVEGRLDGSPPNPARPVAP